MALESIAGSTQAAIAERHGTCTRTVRRALVRVRAAGGCEAAGVDPLDQLRARSAQLDAAIEELGMVRQARSSPAQKSRTIRLQADLMLGKMQLLGSLGALSPIFAESGQFQA